MICTIAHCASMPRRSKGKSESLLRKPEQQLWPSSCARKRLWLDWRKTDGSVLQGTLTGADAVRGVNSQPAQPAAHGDESREGQSSRPTKLRSHVTSKDGRERSRQVSERVHKSRHRSGTLLPKINARGPEGNRCEHVAAGGRCQKQDGGHFVRCVSPRPHQRGRGKHPKPHGHSLSHRFAQRSDGKVGK